MEEVVRPHSKNMEIVDDAHKPREGSGAYVYTLLELIITTGHWTISDNFSELSNKNLMAK